MEPSRKTLTFSYRGAGRPRILEICAEARSQIAGSFTNTTLSAGIIGRPTVARVRTDAESEDVAIRMSFSCSSRASASTSNPRHRPRGLDAEAGCRFELELVLQPPATSAAATMV